MMGDSAEKCAKSLTDAGADVVGANCGDLDPARMAVVVSYLKSATTLPVLAQPNAGRPNLETVQAQGVTMTLKKRQSKQSDCGY